MFAGEICWTVIGPKGELLPVGRQCLQGVGSIWFCGLAAGPGQHKRMQEVERRLHGHGHDSGENLPGFPRMRVRCGVIAHQVSGHHLHRMVIGDAASEGGFGDLRNNRKLADSFAAEGNDPIRLAHQAFQELLFRDNRLVYGIVPTALGKTGVFP